jgi:small subunit ribosomal protein S17
MADEEEKIEETPVSDTGAVSDTASEPEETPAVEATPEVEAVEEVSDTEAEAPADEAVLADETAPAEEASDTEEPAPVKKQRSLRHVPRTERRARTKVAREKPKTRKPIVRLPKPEAVEHVHGRKKVRQGIVTSDKGDKTITVRIDSARRHRRYEKIVRSSTTLRAHDEANDAREGDTVRVIESRPLSRTKRWTLDAVLERAK